MRLPWNLRIWRQQFCPSHSTRVSVLSSSVVLSHPQAICHSPVLRRCCFRRKKLGADVRERMRREMCGYLPVERGDWSEPCESPTHSSSISSSGTIAHRRRRLVQRRPRPPRNAVERSPMPSSPRRIPSSVVVVVAKEDYTAAAAATCVDVRLTNGCVSASTAAARRRLLLQLRASSRPVSRWRYATRWLRPLTASPRARLW